MDLRKIIKFGNSSHVITLPNEWIKEHNLEKGGELSLKTKPDAIIISTQNRLKPQKVALEVENYPGVWLEQKIISYYLKNYNEIILKDSKILKKIKTIKTIKEKLSAVEIVDMKEDEIILRDLTNFKELDLYSFVEKIADMIKTSFDNVINFDKSSWEIISALDLNINRLCFLSYKAINHNLNSWEHSNQVKNSVHYWSYINSLENIGDLIEDIAKVMHKEEIGESREDLKKALIKMKKLFVLTNNLMDKSISLKNNIPLFQKGKEEIESLITNIYHNKSKSDLVLTNIIDYFLRTIRALVLNIIDLRD